MQKFYYFCSVEYFGLISSRLGIAVKQIAATVALLNENATIPFIARYRKEKTGSLNEVQIAAIAEEYHRCLEIDDRKATILKTIEEQGKLTDELRAHCAMLGRDRVGRHLPTLQATP